MQVALHLYISDKIKEREEGEREGRERETEIPLYNNRGVGQQ